jgi:hypothetical protein
VAYIVSLSNWTKIIFGIFFFVQNYTFQNMSRKHHFKFICLLPKESNLYSPALFGWCRPKSEKNDDFLALENENLIIISIRIFFVFLFFY